MSVTREFYKLMQLQEQIRRLVSKKVKSLREDVKTDIFSLECEVCGDKRVKLDGNDFEQWDKDLWNKKHKHTIRRFIRRWIK